MQELDDQELMIQYQNGDHRAFEVLYKRHEAKVYSYLKKRLPHSDNVEEVFQNAFLKVHKSRHNYNPKFLFVQWLYVIARSELLDFCKKKKVVHIEYIEMASEDTSVDGELELKDYKNLSEKEKELLSLKFISDLDYSEISEALNISQSNARKIFSRALKKVKEALTKGES
ncbi:RNA polymerase sigma factor [Halobacteriovorax marinus]|uniref:RNA polymerase sigma factor n=1 Tax=Halobacteriovorax marinus TaxID=97084 RepID=UPI003A8E0DC8